MNEFVNRNVPLKNEQNFGYIKEIDQWKRLNRVDAETKVFIVKGGWRDIREALIKRGWVENKD